MDSDDYSTGWVIDLEKNYRDRTGRVPKRPSHWDGDPEAMPVPPWLLEAVHTRVLVGLEKYHYTDEMAEAKEDIAAWQTLDASLGLGSEVGAPNVSVQSTGTQSLFHALLALRQSGARTVLIATPVYFSVGEACDILHLEARYVSSLLDSGGLPAIGDFVDDISASRPDVVVISQPVFPTGVLWPEEALARVQGVCLAIGANLVVDSTHGGLDWVDHSCLKGLGSDGMDGLVVIQSPAKMLLLNGARFSHVLAPIHVIHRIEDNVHSVSGGISVLQHNFASLVYQRLRKEAEEPTAAQEEHSLARTLQRNVHTVRESARLIDRILGHEDAQRSDTQSGIFSMIMMPSMALTWDNEKRFVTELLDSRGVAVLTGSCFRIQAEGNPLCFRVNHATKREDLLSAVIDALALYEQTLPARRPRTRPSIAET